MSIVKKSFNEGYECLAKMLAQAILELEVKHRDDPLDLTGTLGGMFATIVDLVADTNILYKKATGKEAIRTQNLLGFLLTDILNKKGWELSDDNKFHMKNLIKSLYDGTGMNVDNLFDPVLESVKSTKKSNLN